MAPIDFGTFPPVNVRQTEIVMNRHYSLIAALMFFALAVPASASDKDKQDQESKGDSPPAQQADEEEATPAPLAMGSMAIASNASISIEAMAVDVTIDRVTYDYKLKNDGQSELSLAASAAQPDIEVNSDGSTTYLLPSDRADNVVDLVVKSDGKPLSTKPEMQALALGVDRRADLTKAGIPLIPFGEATDKALAATKPDTIARLEALGLVTPRDPTHTDAPTIGDWSLHVVHSWTQVLGPKHTTDVTVEFSPITAIYTIDASSLSGFDALKEATCLTPQLMNSVKGLLGKKGSTVDVADVLISNDGPARWSENPSARVSVHKPTRDSIVSFCGLDASTQRADVVTGTMPNSGDATALRVLIFARSNPQ